MRLNRFLVVTTLAVTMAGLTSLNSTAKIANGADEEVVQNEDVVQGDAVVDSAKAQIARGKYLAHDVAMCVYCHSPRGVDGKPVESRLFVGSTLPVGTPVGGPEWSNRAPNLRSIAKIWGEEDFAKFLQTGVVPHGGSPKLPMPQFRLNEEDSAAIAKYLKSLK